MAIVITVLLSPFLFLCLLSFFYSLSRLGSGGPALSDAIGSLILFLLLAGIPPGCYVLMIKSWPWIQLRQKYRDQPWMWRADWAEGKIPYSRRKNAVSLWLVWTIVSAAGFGLAIYYAGDAVAIGISSLWLYGVVGAISVWVLFGALLETQRWRKFGTSYCHLTENPGVLGGWLRARIELPLVLAPRDAVQIKLCQVFRSSKSGSGSSSRTVWHVERTVPYDAIEIESNRASFVPVDLFIPKDIGVTGGGSWGSHRWRLEAKAKLRGLDYAADFRVPVFETAASSNDIPAEALALFGDTVDTSSDYRAPEDVQVTPVDGGLEIRQVPPRGSIKYIVCLIILFLAPPAVAYFDLARELAFVKPLSSVLTVVLFLAWLHELYSRRAVILTPTAVIRASRILFYNRKKVVPLEDVREIWIESTQLPTGGEDYRVDIKTKDSPPTYSKDNPPPTDKVSIHWNINIGGITVANNIKKKAQARWLKERIENYLADH